MGVKQVLIAVSSIIVLFLLAIIAVFIIYKLPNPFFANRGISADLDFDVVMPRSRLDEYQKNIVKAELIKKDKDFLWNLKNTLIDSISKLNFTIKQMSGQMKMTNDSANKSVVYHSAAYDSIVKLNALLNISKSELEKLKNSPKVNEKNLSKKIDSLKNANYDEFAQIYNNSNPAEIAKILEKIDEKDAARILKNMNKKKAGKVIESMKPERSASILKLGFDKPE